ncbi:RuvC-like resolvase [Streptomyces phage Mischief19]|nr:RuvC-like resolvase [Streptomyces phage Mischief19]
MSAPVTADMFAVPLRVVGADVSLTSTGLSDGGRHLAVQTSADEQLEVRLDRIVKGVVGMAIGYLGTERKADLVVMEGSAYSKNKQTGHEELAALRLMVRHRMHRLRIPVAIVTPTQLKMWATGYGKATKAQMCAATAERYGVDWSQWLVREGRYDMADALALAAMGYRHLGQPLPLVGGEPTGAVLLKSVNGIEINKEPLS